MEWRSGVDVTRTGSSVEMRKMGGGWERSESERRKGSERGLHEEPQAKVGLRSEPS